MAQLTGSGAGHGTNYAMVDDSLGAKEGRLMTVGSITSMPTISVAAGSQSYLYGKSGADWMPLAVQSGTEAILRTSATVNVSVGSESYNYLKSGAGWVTDPQYRDVVISGVPQIGIRQTGSDNHIDIANNIGTISTNNSSTSTLGSNVAFTGTSEDVKDYAAIGVSIFADQDSKTDGLSLEWSQDGTNWDETMTVDIGASKVESYEFGVRARYFRLVYTNGATAQGAFRLQTIYHPVRTRQGARCLCVDLDNREFAPTRRAVIAGQKPNTDYTNIQATAAGNLKIAVEEINGTSALPPGTNFVGYMGVAPSGTFVVDTNLYAGSEAFVPAGSMIVTNRVAGSIVNMPTVTVAGIATAGSLATQTVDGTVTVTDIATAGSLATQTVDGTVTVTGIATAGSLAVQAVSATNLDIRDLSSASDSVTATINSPASIGSYTTQTVDGTVTVNNLATAGSLATQTVDGTVTVTGIATAGSLATQTVDGTVTVTGIATAGSLATQTVDGTVTVTGIATAGSLSVQNVGEITMEDVGSPCFKQATATASGTYTQVWPIGGAGSKLEVHGWKISTRLAGYVRLLRSGGTPVVVADYYMAYASGAVIEKTFVMPIVPGGADIHMGVGTTVAGSTSVTIYGREVK